jgi:hypothetical protein
MALEERSPSDWHQPGGQKSHASGGNFKPFPIWLFCVASYMKYLTVIQTYDRLKNRTYEKPANQWTVYCEREAKSLHDWNYANVMSWFSTYTIGLSRQWRDFF